MLVETRNALIRSAAQAALILDRCLTVLLDEYDFYLERSGALTTSETLEQKDVLVSIHELGTLPTQLANRIDDWSRDKQHELSQLGFEVHVLNEFSLHMFAIATFLHNKHIEPDLDQSEIGKAFLTLRNVNSLLK